MISPLLDPNQIPLVRSPERRPDAPMARGFEQAVSATSPDAMVSSSSIELNVQDDSGSTRTISLPWGLAASPRLSQTESGIAAQTQLFLRLQPAAALLKRGGAAQQDNNAGYRIGASPVLTPSEAGPMTAALFVGRESAPLSARPAPGSAASQQADTGTPWQERWLQWLLGSSGDLRLRLRDYRLDEADYPQLLEQLHLFARDQGLALTRISVNGHELWRMPEPGTGNHHGR